jgi:hypothetical protein
MRLHQLLTESISPVVYHYTGLTNAIKILKSGVFQLSSVAGSVEQQYAPEGKPYFLSTTRTRRGGYHEIVGSTAVLLQMDGAWYNSRYSGGPVDYWGNRDPLKAHHRSHEAEDRIYSSKPTIPADGITGVHILVTEDAEPAGRARARQLMILCKKSGISVHLYSDKASWRNFDTRKGSSVDILKGAERTGGYVSTHPGYLQPWIQILSAPDSTQLGKKALELKYSLRYINDYRLTDMARGLANDLSNARKPDSGRDREHAIKIINYMQKNKLPSIRDFVSAMADKWKNIGDNKN